MSFEVDEFLFSALAALDPREVCAKMNCRFDEALGRYYLNCWGDDYSIDCDRKQLSRVGGTGVDPHEYLPVFLINYLIQGKGVPLSDELISEKDMAGGVGFFRGPHEIPTTMISTRFKNDLDLLSNCCERLGGQLLNMADRSYLFQPLAHVSIALLYWVGDEDFPPEAKLLFDKSIAQNLALDSIYALAVDFCSRISQIAGVMGEARYCLTPRR